MPNPPLLDSLLNERCRWANEPIYYEQLYCRSCEGRFSFRELADVVTYYFMNQERRLGHKIF